MNKQFHKKQSRRTMLFDGLAYGFLMYICMTFVYPAIFDDVEMTFKSVMLGIPLWLTAGLGYSWLKTLVVHGFSNSVPERSKS